MWCNRSKELKILLQPAKAKFILLLLPVAVGMKSFCTTRIITNSAMTFVPATITIILSDSVNFILSPEHIVSEVSQSSWDVNDTTPLPGGFQTGFGGGLIDSSQLQEGVHYYVCKQHAADGMKGKIIVQHHAGIEENQWIENISVSPNPSSGAVNVLFQEKLMKNVTVHVYANDGRLVKSSLVSQSESKMQLNLSDIAKGIYAIEVTDGKNVSIRSIILQ
jgi:plastocyanin